MEETDGMIKLNLTNYPTWKQLMEDLLYCKDLYKPIKVSEKPSNIEKEEWEVQHRKCIAYIRRWMEMNLHEHISNETRADVVWQKLENLFAKKTAGNKISLLKRLVNLKYRDGGSMVEHTSQFQSLVNQLLTMKMKMDDEMQASLLLSSLPESWETLVITITNSMSEGTLTMDLVKDTLLNEEVRRKAQGDYSSGALITERQERRGRSLNRNSHGSRGRSKSRKSIKCFHCNKLGHMKKECRIWKREQREQNEGKRNDKETNLVSTDGDVVIVCDDSCVNLITEECNWVVDSGASFHVTSRDDFFTSYNSGDFGNVRMGNTGASKIVGIGDVCLETGTGNKLILKDVRHVPDIRLNLISTGKLDDEGFTNYFGESKWKLTKGSLIVARGKKINSLYVMEARLQKGEINAVQNGSSIDLWHQRLGHISEKGLQTLVRKKFIPDLQGTTIKTCDHCLVGKTHRVSFHKHPPSRKSHVLDLIHTDVCTMQSRTLGGAIYFVTFIDDHSRKVWAHALKTKNQVLDVFKELHTSLERETGRTLKCVRADNGGEYRGPFEKYCASKGIRLEKTVPKTPQHNGVAERMNRTIGERIRCMLSHSRLPKSFWGEAMRTAVDLINLSPSVPLNGDVPDRVWTGKEVSYAHLRVFGCRAFVHIPKDERSKLDDKAKSCIFLGYGHEEFGYRLRDSVN